ncbi:MAG: hypothetical protein IT426_18980 [Pirellulales bacterium]|nr:hypothetical protein [Pirellulales bacterium]
MPLPFPIPTLYPDPFLEYRAMSARERWIVYPLLFLTLGIAMRNQFLPTKRMGAVDFRAGELSAQTIHCNNLEVMQDGIVHKNLGVAQELQFQRARGNAIRTDYAESQQSKTGEAEFQKLAVTDAQGKPVVVMLEDQNTKSGAIQTMTAAGAPQVQIHSNNAGGVVKAIGHLGQALVAMGHEGKVFGVFGQYPQQGPPFLLTSLWPFQTQPATPKLAPLPLPKTPAAKENESRKEAPKKNDADREDLKIEGPKPGIEGT